MNLESTRVTNRRGMKRRHSQRLGHSRKTWSLSANQFNEMTLEEILKHAKLPKRLLRGDVDHEDTTDALDERVLAARLSRVN